MKWFGNRWLWDQYPEFDQFSTVQRKRVFHRAYWRSFRRWQTWLVLLPCALLPLEASMFVRSTWGGHLRHIAAIQLVVMYSLLFIGIVVFIHWNMRITVRYMRESLPHLCINCGYDLRATPDRCPECGAIRENHEHQTTSDLTLD